jgi:hypothetical protein
LAAFCALVSTSAIFAVPARASLCLLDGPTEGIHFVIHLADARPDVFFVAHAVVPPATNSPIDIVARAAMKFRMFSLLLPPVRASLPDDIPLRARTVKSRLRTPNVNRCQPGSALDSIAIKY